jgi:hypothetical protein
LLATSSSFFGIEIFEHGFDLIETSKQLDGLLRDPALVIGPEIVFVSSKLTRPVS